MKADELIPGERYWLMQFGTMTDGIYQGELLGRSESQQRGFLFVVDNLKIKTLWTIDLYYVFTDPEAAYYNLAIWHEEQADKFFKLSEKHSESKQTDT